MARRISSAIVIVVIAAAAIALPYAASAEKSVCRKALEKRIGVCTESCMKKALDAVDPEMRSRMTGYECGANCSKLEMFKGNTCPAE